MNHSELIEQLRGHADRIEPAPHRFVCEAQDIRCAADTIDQLSAEVERLKASSTVAGGVLDSFNEFTAKALIDATEDRDRLAQRVAELEADLAKEREIGDKLFAKLREAEARAVQSRSDSEILEWILDRNNQEWLFGGGQEVSFCFPPKLANAYDLRGAVLASITATSVAGTSDSESVNDSPPHGKDAQGGV